jgi:hypothetical protein
MLNLNDANLGGDKELVKKYQSGLLSSRKKTGDYPGGTDSPSYIANGTRPNIRSLVDNPLYRVLLMAMFCPAILNRNTEEEV